jgi:hypothetical protein
MVLLVALSMFSGVQDAARGYTSTARLPKVHDGIAGTTTEDTRVPLQHFAAAVAKHEVAVGKLDDSRQRLAAAQARRQGGPVVDYRTASVATQVVPTRPSVLKPFEAYSTCPDGHYGVHQLRRVDERSLERACFWDGCGQTWREQP